MAYEIITIKTDDGACPSYLFKPKEHRTAPGVIFCMDGFGIRPTLFQMAQQLADTGYVVLLPDLFYRAGPYETLEPSRLVAEGNAMRAIGHLLASTDNRRAAQDARAFLDYLDQRSDISGERYGLTGYCMGDGIALSIAGTWPTRVAAAASFHGGNLAIDDEMSPHLLAPAIDARVYIAGADNDPWYTPAMAERLEFAFVEAGVNHHCEIYAGALHGFTMSDVPVYNEAAALRHWQQLIALLSTTL